MQRMRLGRPAMRLMLAVALFTGAAAARPRPEHGHRREPLFEPVADPYPSTYKAPASAPVMLVGATILDGAGQRIGNGEMVLVGGKIQLL